MPITPSFEIHQTSSHVILEIRVPHIRVRRDSLQVELSDADSVLHFASPPIYLLRLDFSPHQFRCLDQHTITSDDDGNDDDDDEMGVEYKMTAAPSGSLMASAEALSHGNHSLCSANNDSSNQNNSKITEEEDIVFPTEGSSSLTFLPLIRNGTVRLVLAKLVAGVDWPDLDLMGRLVGSRGGEATVRGRKQQQSSNHPGSSSQWLQSIVVNPMDDSDIQNEDDSNKAGVSDCDGVQAIERSSLSQTGLYGFARIFRGVFSDLNRDGLVREMLEGPWINDSEGDVEDLMCAAQVSRLPSEAQRLDAASLGIGWIEEAATAKSVPDKDVPNALPFKSQHWNRCRERRKFENHHFCSDRYLADWQLDDDDDDCEDGGMYANAFCMQPHWMSNVTPCTSTFAFTPEERIALASIPYPLLPFSLLKPMSVNGADHSNHGTSLWELEHRLCVGLVDILFAYVYDHLLTDGDPTVESAWTVSKLSASLSWLEDWLDKDEEEDVPLVPDALDNCRWQWKQRDEFRTTLSLARQVVISSTRRALIFPYIRTIRLAAQVWKHVALILRHGGVRTVIRCLLQIRTMLNCNDVHYLGNKLFIDPYLTWLQQCNSASRFEESHFVALADAIEMTVGLDGDGDNALDRLKESLDLDLIDLEAENFAGEVYSGDDIINNHDDEENDLSSDSDSDSDTTSNTGSASDSGDLIALETDMGTISVDEATSDSSSKVKPLNTTITLADEQNGSAIVLEGSSSIVAPVDSGNRDEVCELSNDLLDLNISGKTSYDTCCMPINLNPLMKEPTRNKNLRTCGNDKAQLIQEMD